MNIKFHFVPQHKLQTVPIGSAYVLITDLSLDHNSRLVIINISFGIYADL